MQERHTSRRRQFLKGAGATGLVVTTGSAGCLGDLTGGGGPIPMGSILPITGALSQYGSGMQEAVNIAVQHVNEAGGPLGREISMSNRDSETSADRAVQKYNALVNEEDIVGFVGAASSGVSTAIAQNVADDQVMEVSNASTSPALAEIGYGTVDGEELKFFGRTSPNDLQQGIVMGRILSEDQYVGASSASFLYVNNPYGEGLANQASQSFSGETLQSVGYDPQSTDYTSTLDSVFEGDPDAVGFVGYPGNGRTILQQWNEGGYGGKWVLSEGLNSSEFLQSLSDITDGMYLASPDPESTPGSTRFEEAIGDANTLFAAHAYDALVLQALAMHKAGEASGPAIARNIRSVSRQGNNFTVGDIEAAFGALDNDEDINYQGASSPVNLKPTLEPLNRFAILQVSNGSTETLETIPRSFFEGRL